MTIIFANLFIIIFQKDVISYLDNLNNLNRDLLSGNNINTESSEAVLDLRFIGEEKFRRLQETKVDYTGLVLPDDFASSTGSTTTAETDFKVGNKNPFKSF